MEQKPPGYDFPFWLSPTIVKELRQGLRTYIFTLSLVLLPIAMAGIYILGFLKDQGNKSILHSSSINIFYWIFVIAVLFFIIPFKALSSVKEEKDAGTSDILLLTNLSPFRIIWSKWSSLSLQTVLLLFTLVPFIFVRYYYGAANPVYDLCSLGLVFITSTVLIATAIWLSGTHKAIKGLIIIPAILLILFFSEKLNLFDDEFSINEQEIILTSLVFIYDILVIGLIFLLCATKWFSLPSENNSARIRLPMLLFVVPSFIMIFENTVSVNHDMRDIHFTIYAIASLFFLFLELNMPQEFLPTHVKMKKAHRFAAIRNLLLAPGFASAAAFSLVVFIIYFAFLAIFKLKEHETPYEYLKLPFSMMHLYYSLVFPSFCLWLFRKKLKGALPFIYLGIIPLCLWVSSIMHSLNYETIMFLIPWSNINDNYLNSFNYHSIITLTLFAFTISCVAYALAKSRKTIQAAKKLDYLNPAAPEH